MKKTMLKLLSVAMIGTLTFLSCSRDAKIQTAEPVAKVAKTPTTPSYANPANPYDYIGAAHNNLLDDFAHYYLTNSIVYSSANSFYQGTVSRMATSELYDNSQNLLGNGEFLSMMYNYFGNDELTSTPELSADFYEYASQIDTRVNDVNDLTSATDIASLTTDLMTMEDEISNSRLSSEEKEMLLSAAAVARYSSNYWYNVQVVGGTDWNSMGLGSTVAMPMSAGGCARADLGGAVEGAIGGFLTGGPAGIGPGAMGGAVVSSLRYTLHAFFGWF